MSLIIPTARKGCFLGQVDPDQYHAEKNDYTISKSMLSDLMDSTYKFKYNRDREIKKSSSGFAFGNLVDCLALTPDRFESVYHVVEKKPNSGTKADTALREEMNELGKTELISNKELADAREAVANLNVHLESQWGLVLNKTFISQVAWNCRLKKVDGISLEARGMLDAMPTVDHMPDTLVDVKTVGRNIDDWRLMQWDFWRYRYHMQGAMYLDGVNMAIGRNQYKQFVFVCVESVAPFRTLSVVMSDKDYCVGAADWRMGRDLYARCMATGDWGSNVIDVRNGMIPEKKLREIESEVRFNDACCY